MRLPAGLGAKDASHRRWENGELYIMCMSLQVTHNTEQFFDLREFSDASDLERPMSYGWMFLMVMNSKTNPIDSIK